MNNKSIKQNIGIAMLMKPISIGLTFVYTPIVLNFLGEAKYGVWAIILNVLSWITYFDIGIGNGLRNKLADAYARGDRESSQIFVSTGYLVSSFVSFIFCVTLLIVWNGFHLSSLFKLNLGGYETDWAINISIIMVSINFVLSLARIVLFAIHKNGLLSVLGVIVQVLQIIVLLVLSVYLKEDIVAVSIMYGLVTIFSNIVVASLIRVRYPYLSPKFKMVRKKCVKPLMALGIGFFIIQISSLVLNTTDNLLISGMYGSASVTPYSMVYKFFYLFIQVHSIVIMPMWSAYTSANSTKDYEWMRNAIRKMNLFSLFLSIGVVAAIFLFEPFSELWLGRKLKYGMSLIILVAFYMIAQMFSNNYSAFLNGVGEIRSTVILSFFGSIINIPISIFLARNLGLGLTGIIGGSLVALLPTNIILPIVTRQWFLKRIVA